MNAVEKEDIDKIIESIDVSKCAGKVFLVTGATGFMGKYIVNTLMCLKTGKVIVVVRSKEKARNVFSEWWECERFSYVEQDIQIPLMIEQNIDYIFHASGCSNANFASQNPSSVYSVNVIGTINVLNLARDKKIDGILLFSSGAAYGTVPHDYIGEIDDNYIFAVSENQAIGSFAYANAKQAMEILGKIYYSQYNVPVKIVRISHTYGPGIDLDDGHVYSDFCKAIIQRKKLIVRNGGAIRPLCYISDAIIAFFKIMFNGECDEVYNMANIDQTYSMRNLAEKLVKEAFADRKIRYFIENDTVIEYRNWPSINKLKRLGWDPQIDVVSGFQRTVKSFEI